MPSSKSEMAPSATAPVPCYQVEVPGRANLIGEHIDYHNLPVLPIALRRSIRMRFSLRSDQVISATSENHGSRCFEWTPYLQTAAPGDWENYLRAAAQTVTGRWGVLRGIDASITSDLPAAAGLSSSSALLVAVTLGLLRANGVETSFEELMGLLPEGEQFVGTRGGGMDHAAVLGSREGCASLISFCPIGIKHIPIPSDWAFLVADSGVRAEKSGAVRERYNAIRAGGAEAREHVATESARVARAVEALQHDDPECFGKLLLDSHVSLRDRLRVSVPELDHLVEAAMSAGAFGARLTGAGFGGCAIILCHRRNLERVRAGLAPAPVIDAEPGPGAVHS
jgi:galactokinase